MQVICKVSALCETLFELELGFLYIKLNHSYIYVYEKRFKSANADIV